MAWLTNWNYRKAITVSNSGSTLTDYQVLTTIDTLTLINAGKMRSDCGDVRFTDTDGSTLINYWIESGQNTVSTKIWAKIPSIPIGTKTIYLYYGNIAATYDNSIGGTNTFLFFDDFEYSDSVTNHGWTINQQPPVVESGWLKCAAANGATGPDAGALRTTNTFANPFIVDFKYKFNLPNNGFTVTLGLSQTAHPYADNNGIGVKGKFWGVDVGKAYATNNHDYVGATLLFAGLANTEYSGSLTYKPDNTIYVSSNSQSANLVTQYMSTSTGSYIKIAAMDYIQTIWVDNVRARKYTSPEPTLSTIGTEETPTNITATSMTITPSESPCRVGICTVTVNVTWTNNGGTSGDFIPNITIDGTPYSSPYPLQSLGAGLPVTKTFVVSGLTVGTRNICPYPN